MSSPVVASGRNTATHCTKQARFERLSRTREWLTPNNTHNSLQHFDNKHQGERREDDALDNQDSICDPSSCLISDVHLLNEVSIVLGIV